jgi:hypothetical protein
VGSHFVDTVGNAYLLTKLVQNGATSGGVFTPAAANGVAPTGRLYSVDLNVLRAEPVEVDGVAGQELRIAAGGAPLGAWLTQLEINQWANVGTGAWLAQLRADGAPVLSTDAGAFYVTSFDLVEGTITVVPTDAMAGAKDTFVFRLSDPRSQLHLCSR